MIQQQMQTSLAALATALTDYLTCKQAPDTLRLAFQTLATQVLEGPPEQLSQAMLTATRAVRAELAKQKQESAAPETISSQEPPLLAKLFISDGGEPFALPWPSSLALRWEASGYVGEPLASAYAQEKGAPLPVLAPSDLAELRAAWNRLHDLGEASLCRGLKPAMSKLEADHARGLAALPAKSAVPGPCDDGTMPAEPTGASYGQGYQAGWNACRQATLLTLRQYPPQGLPSGTPERVTDLNSLATTEQHALSRLRHTLGVTHLDLADTLNRANTILRRQQRTNRT